MWKDIFVKTFREKISQIRLDLDVEELAIDICLFIAIGTIIAAVLFLIYSIIVG